MTKNRLLTRLGKRSAFSLSHTILLLLVALTALVFGAFYAVGFDTPYVEDVTMVDPLLTDLLLGFVDVLLLVTVVVCGISLYREWRSRKSEAVATSGIAAKKIVMGVFAMGVLIMMLTFLLGSEEAVMVNGEAYTDSFWLKLTDMFINTAMVLILIAIAVAVYGGLGLNRRKKHEKV